VAEDAAPRRCRQRATGTTRCRIVGRGNLYTRRQIVSEDQVRCYRTGSVSDVESQRAHAPRGSGIGCKDLAECRQGLTDEESKSTSKTPHRNRGYDRVGRRIEH